MSFAQGVQAQVVEAGKSMIVRRAVDGVFEVASSAMLGSTNPSDLSTSSAAGFSVGATAFIALTSAALGGLAGWALHDLFSRR